MLLRVEEFSPDPGVERLGNDDLPRGSWRDVRHAGGDTDLALTPQSLGN